MMGTAFTALGWGLVLAAGVLLWRTDREAKAKGARLGPHVRRGRAACSRAGCGRMFWTDHGWQPHDGPELYCTPRCVPHPTHPSNRGDQPR